MALRKPFHSRFPTPQRNKMVCGLNKDPKGLINDSAQNAIVTPLLRKIPNKIKIVRRTNAFTNAVLNLTDNCVEARSLNFENIKISS